MEYFFLDCILGLRLFNFRSSRKGLLFFLKNHLFLHMQMSNHLNLINGIRIAILSYLCALFSINLPAQGKHPYLQFKNLSQIQVTCMLMGDNNELWIGTKDGINKFNIKTHKIENFEQNPNLRLGHVFDIERDRNGEIWYLNSEGVFNMKGQSWPNSKKGNGPRFSVYFVFDHKNQMIWLNEKREIIVQTTTGDEVNINTFYPFLSPSGYQDNPFWDPEMEALVIRNEQGKVYFLGEKIDSLFINVEEKIEHFFKGEDGNFYFLTSKGIFEVAGQGNNPERYRFDHSNHLNPNKDPFILYKVDSKGNIYFTENWKLKRIEGSKIIDYGNSFLLPTSFAMGSNNEVFWGTEEGLIVYPGEKFTYWGKNENVINPWSISTTKEGYLFYSGYGTGLFRFDPSKDSFTRELNFEQALVQKGVPIGFLPWFYMGAIRDHWGRMVFPMIGPGIVVSDGKSIDLVGSLDTLNTYAPFAIYDDSPNHRYLVGSNNLIVIDYENGKHYPILFDSTFFPSSNILAIEKDKKGRFWLGGRKQLAIWDGKDFQHVDYPGGGLALHCDFKGNMWSSGIPGGLWVHDLDNNQRHKVLEVPLNRSVDFLQSIDTTYLLMGAVDGLYVLNLSHFYKTGKAYAAKFDESSGLVGNECGQNGIHKSDNGIFYFTTNDAIMRLDSRKFKEELGYPYDTVSLRIRKATEISGSSSLDLRDFKRNSFHYFQNSFQVTFDSLPFGEAPFKFRLVSLDNGQAPLPNWKEGRGEIILQGVAPGNFRLEIQPILHGNKLTLAEMITLEFRVLPPWRFWVWVVLGVLGFGLVAGLVIRRILGERAKNKKLERERKLLSFQLTSLSNQANEHFLGNALTNFQGAMYSPDTVEGRRVMSDILVSLGDMSKSLRFASPFWTLQQELYFTESFLKIERIRYSFKIEIAVSLGIQAKLDKIILPKTIVQSIIENGIKYGARSRSDKMGEVKVAIFQEGDSLVVSVKDNGLGLEASEKDNRTRTRKGNQNIRSTFEVLNQSAQEPRFQFTIRDLVENGQVTGVESRIKIPIQFSYPKL
ncbi:MAG: histidine kinase [Bacteroidia bacterium]|nr:histidine kinase [Bacteroidia bacterium]